MSQPLRAWPSKRSFHWMGAAASDGRMCGAGVGPAAQPAADGGWLLAPGIRHAGSGRAAHAPSEQRARLRGCAAQLVRYSGPMRPAASDRPRQAPWRCSTPPSRPDAAGLTISLHGSLGCGARLLQLQVQGGDGLGGRRGRRAVAVPATSSAGPGGSTPGCAHVHGPPASPGKHSSGRARPGGRGARGRADWPQSSRPAAARCRRLPMSDLTSCPGPAHLRGVHLLGTGAPLRQLRLRAAPLPLADRPQRWTGVHSSIAALGAASGACAALRALNAARLHGC
jgi:hypothetical protein